MKPFVLNLQQAFVTQAERHTETLMPGYTHMQPAQPISAAHWLMSFFWMLARDYERLEQARSRVAELPLGSGALAGTPFAINREELARELGFETYSQNSLDAVSDRDFAVELLFITALMSVHLSRFAEDIIICSHPAFGFIALSDRYSTGSSLMPQKRNADPMELTRGKAGRLIGHLTAILSTLKALPSGYNKDLQEDKEALFDAVDTMHNLLPVLTGVVLTMELNPERMLAALDEDMLATDLADYLVEKDIPFRQAHHIAGRVVRLAVEQGVGLTALPLDALRTISDRFSADVYEWLDFKRAIERRQAPGGTAPSAVRQQIEHAKAWLARR
jgi:argininosuccinate lyase